jgi:hypothetical protein
MAQPVTTLIPFAQLPACATSCGPLFDANGACVPPVQAAVQTDCFCNYARLVPWTSQANGVCDYACTATPSDMTRIQGWFQSFCGVQGNQVVTQTVTGAGSGSSSGGSRGSSGGEGGDWLSTHWRWVIMLVIIVVGIAGIWIGACIWRRRYIKKKERARAFGKHSGSASRPSWGPGVGGPAAAHPAYGPGAAAASAQRKSGGLAATATPATMTAPGVFMPGPAAGPAAYSEKPKKEKKKWVVKERT